MTRSWCTAGALTGLVLAVSGCGALDVAPTDTARRFYDAVEHRDGAAACALLVAATREQLEESAGVPCAEALLQEDVPAPGRRTATEVFGTMAQVRYADETAFLARAEGGWRVLAVGCGARPAARDRPYDCQVEGG